MSNLNVENDANKKTSKNVAQDQKNKMGKQKGESGAKTNEDIAFQAADDFDKNRAEPENFKPSDEVGESEESDKH